MFVNQSFHKDKDTHTQPKKKRLQKKQKKIHILCLHLPHSICTNKDSCQYHQQWRRIHSFTVNVNTSSDGFIECSIFTTVGIYQLPNDCLWVDSSWFYLHTIVCSDANLDRNTQCGPFPHRALKNKHHHNRFTVCCLTNFGLTAPTTDLYEHSSSSLYQS